MPYKVKGSTVYKKGKAWRKAGSHAKAVAMVRAIGMREHGITPKKRSTRKRTTRSR